MLVSSSSIAARYSLFHATKSPAILAATAVRYGFDRVLHLPLPELSERGRVWTTTELYYERAAPSKVELECRECSVRTPHREQARLLTQPNVLLLQVQRRRGAMRMQAVSTSVVESDAGSLHDDDVIEVDLPMHIDGWRQG